MPLIPALVAAAGPFVVNALLSLGIGVVAFVGLQPIIDGLISQAMANWAAMPSMVLQFLTMAGCSEAMAILSAGLTTRVAMIPLKRFRIK